MKMRYISCLIILGSLSMDATPTVDILFSGLFGNNLWQYCVGKIIAEELGYKCYCPLLYGFPDTYLCPRNMPLASYRTELIRGDHSIDIARIVNNRKDRNIRLEGYFQRYEYLKPYSEKIRTKWLKIDERLVQASQHQDDVLVHVRCVAGEYNTQYPGCVPFDYYRKALSMVSYRRVIICTDEPTHPFLKNFVPYNPIIHSTRSLVKLIKSGYSASDIAQINFDEFAYMLSFNKMILSYSTFAWWIGFLSNAQEVYMPYPDGTTNYYSYGKIEESRFHYISTQVGAR
jgi:hypothetical protein